MSGYPEHERYSLVAIVLHWTIAACVIGLMAVGFVMAEYGVQLGIDLTFQLYQLHKSFGVLVFVLTVLRLAWRLTHRPPPLPAAMRPAEKALARFVHIGFYVLLLVTPLAGWAVVSAAMFKVPTNIFGLFVLPPIPFVADYPDAKAAERLTETVHATLASLVAVLLVLHVAGALKHRFFDRDDVLRRMWPRRRR